MTPWGSIFALPCSKDLWDLAEICASKLLQASPFFSALPGEQDAFGDQSAQDSWIKPQSPTGLMRCQHYPPCLQISFKSLWRNADGHGLPQDWGVPLLHNPALCTPTCFCLLTPFLNERLAVQIALLSVHTRRPW